jgi:hypothetical protein
MRKKTVVIVVDYSKRFDFLDNIIFEKEKV